MKKRIIIVFIILIAIGIIIYINLDDQKTNNSNVIEYEETIIDWNNYEIKEIELTDSLKVTEEGVYLLSGEIDGNIH